MTLRRKILLRIYILTFLIIVAMSVTYYYLFTLDIRERSYQNVTLTFNLIRDDLSTRIDDVSLKTSQFVENSLASPTYTVQMLQSQQDPSDRDATLWNVKRSMTYLHLITSKMRDFGGLVGASEILVYGEKRTLIAAYRQENEDIKSEVYLADIQPDMMVPVHPDDRWFATLQTLDEIPFSPFMEDIPLEYQHAIPEASTVSVTSVRDRMTLQFSLPIVERDNVQGVCVVHLAIQQLDVERYARLTGTEVNVFTGSAFSVGTLPAYNFLPKDLTTAATTLDLSHTASLSEFSDTTIRGNSYYQGTLAFGEESGLVGAISVLYPRWLEEKQKRNFLIAVAGVTLIFSLIVAVEALGLTSSIVLPIIHLMDTMQEMKSGNLDVVAEVESQDEVGRLAETFNTMTAKLKSSFEKIEEQTQSLEEQNAELKRLDKLKDEFLSNTSHELRTPLNGITGLADGILSGVDGPITDEERKHVRMILQSSKRLTHLVDSLLDFSKARSETLALNIQAFPVSEVVDMVCAFSTGLLHEKPITLHQELPKNLPEVYGDIDKVEQILTNLVGNAIKFTHEGRITISAQMDGHFLKIVVRDTGIGISQDSLSHIFLPFEQADGSITREFGGTGLGLAISKELVELQGGQIGVESNIGMGSAFFFTLPCQEGPINERIVEKPRTTLLAENVLQEYDDSEQLFTETAAIQVSGHGKTIMVIDDDPTNIEVLRSQLHHAGFQVITARDGHEAFQIINGDRIDLILCDVMMPLVDGYTFAMRMRERERLRNIPLIFVSAKTQKADKIRGYQVGASDYMTKPIEPDELLMKIHALLQLYQTTPTQEDKVVGTYDTVYDTEQDKDMQYAKPKMGNGEKILVVDDEPINVEVLRTQLAQANYDVLTAPDGITALEIIEQEQLHLVLLDLMMPKMSGFKVCKILREEKGLTDLPIIMLTAKSNIYDKVYGLNIGANDYIIKPFDKEELLTRIHLLLSLANLQKQLVQNNLALQIEVVERKQAEEALRQFNDELEERVSSRTLELETSLAQLKQAQHQLVEAEKMAALGRLVAGIAHEVNTPIGVGVTAASHLEHLTLKLKQQYQQNEMTRSDLEKYIHVATDSSAMVLGNLQRAANLIQSFKQVAVDQTHEGKRRFLVKSYLEETLFSLGAHLRRTRHKISITGDDSINMDSYPGVLAQVVTSLVMNSLTHAYAKNESGILCFEIQQEEHHLVLEYSDNGCGIPHDSLGKIFEPFFTTARGRGGTGLGLHIVYNLVVQKLHGRIRCDSQVGEGTTFVLRLPLNLDDVKEEYRSAN